MKFLGKKIVIWCCKIWSKSSSFETSKLFSNGDRLFSFFLTKTSFFFTVQSLVSRFFSVHTKNIDINIFCVFLRSENWRTFRRHKKTHSRDLFFIYFFEEKIKIKNFVIATKKREKCILVGAQKKLSHISHKKFNFDHWSQSDFEGRKKRH